MMKNSFSFFIVMILSFLIYFPACTGQKIQVSSFCESLTPVGRILEDSTWTNWDMAPIYDEDGMIHLFVGRWSRGTSWLKSAQIVHYISKDPGGPYQLIDTVFQSDSVSFYNPQIKKAGTKYVLVYSYREKSWPNLNQQIGLATSSSLNGPWKQSRYNPVIAPSFISGSANCIHASNPTFLTDKNGNYRIYYKSISDKPDNPNLRTISMAFSGDPEGPYKNYEANPIISYVKYGMDIEDPYSFIFNDKYYIILEDRRGVREILNGKNVDHKNIREGGVRPGLIYKSSDGTKWETPEVAYQTNEYYFKEPVKRMERPNILWKDGKPAYLFLALEEGKYGLGSGVVLKIGEWK